MIVLSDSTREGIKISQVSRVSIEFHFLLINWSYKKKRNANKQLGPWHFKSISIMLGAYKSQNGVNTTIK